MNLVFSMSRAIVATWRRIITVQVLSWRKQGRSSALRSWLLSPEGEPDYLPTPACCCQPASAKRFCVRTCKSVPPPSSRFRQESLVLSKTSSSVCDQKPVLPDPSGTLLLQSFSSLLRGNIFLFSGISVDVQICSNMSCPKQKIHVQYMSVSSCSSVSLMMFTA